MGPIVYAENTLMYRSLGNSNLNNFTKVKLLRRLKHDHLQDVKKHLVSSNNRSLIVMANGRQTDIAKGTNDEFRLWQVKDATISPGNYYYFSSPDEAGRSFNTKYNRCDVYDWRNRQYQFSNDEDENSFQDVTIVK
jgi:hypothetical protein